MKKSVNKKTEKVFDLNTKWPPAGDQPKAIKSLIEGLDKGLRHQTLFGITASGKTFSVANVIANHGKPTLVIAHNKTLAAQLAEEYRDFFPNNAVHYFVSYYDFYQPEAYMPVTDTYIEKEAMINDEIDRLRHASTQALLTRKDVIIVASVSCIYGLGSPEEYKKRNLEIEKGQDISRADFIRNLIKIHYERTNADLESGTFRALGNSVEIMPVNDNVIYRLNFNEEKGISRIEEIIKIDAISRTIISNLEDLFIFPAKHFVSTKEQNERAFETIKIELEERLKELEKEGKNLEAERLKRRVRYDLSLIKEVGYCNGIENYSRHFSGKNTGEPPDTLLSYFPHKADGTPDFLTIIDESHVTVPQLNGMFAGDASRKKTLVDFGFRLPSAKDNRPLKFNEFDERVGQIIYTTATPSKYELEKSENIAEQVIRPTGLLDPEVEIRGIIENKETKYKGQIFDFIDEAEKVIKKGDRVIATTLTKKMAEDLSEFLKEKGIKAEYLHSEIETLDRIRILAEFRKGSARAGFDCIVGVNLLREGLDLPEVSLIGILDADKEGFLRSETSLIQTIGRCARNVNGKVILYADKITNSIIKAMGETKRRRALQIKYNTEHNITPETIIKEIRSITDSMDSEHNKAVRKITDLDLATYTGKRAINKLIKQKEQEMNDAVKILDFETASLLRDEIIAIKNKTKK
ncbi:MAG: excinuclease ABC subunit UvrB [bacterium]|nr:excinuclease ABC subunit UvrB [bacterium]